MLKFSGSADLHEHVHPTHSVEFIVDLSKPLSEVVWSEITPKCHTTTAPQH